MANEEDEWLSAMSDVTPLSDKSATDEPAEDAPVTGLAERLRLRREAEEPDRESSVYNLDRRTEDRLRNGLIPIEGSLDLHGLTQQEAATALDSFLLQAYHEGWSCLLVATGKGTAIDGGGVLRSAVPRWLSEGRHRDRVAAVTVATPRHGGDGALYVLLQEPDAD